MFTPGTPTGRGRTPGCGEPAAEPWGLTEMQIEDPGGIRIVLATVADHERVTAVAVAVARAQGRG
jgi:hypothetical protein